jgi:hypothetical protein
MGMFDTIVGTCPSCKAPFHCQTKIGQCALDDIKVGDAFDVDDMNVELKDFCYCGAYVTAVVRARRLARLRIGGADLREGLWGTLSPASGDRDAQLDAQEKAFMQQVHELINGPKEKP